MYSSTSARCDFSSSDDLMSRRAASMARSATWPFSSASAFDFSSWICLRAWATRSSASLRARAVRSWRSASTSCFDFCASSAASRCAAASDALCSPSSLSASARSFLACSIASRMVRSRSSSILTIGPKANLASTTIRMRKVIAVQSVSPGLRSMMPAARTGVTRAFIERTPGGDALRECDQRLLVDGEEQAHHDGEQRRAFDEGGGDDHRGADVAGGGGLAGGALQRGGGQAADAETHTDDGQAGAEAGSEVTKSEGG